MCLLNNILKQLICFIITFCQNAEKYEIRYQIKAYIVFNVYFQDNIPLIHPQERLSISFTNDVFQSIIFVLFFSCFMFSWCLYGDMSKEI